MRQGAADSQGEWQHPYGAPHGWVTLQSPLVWAAVGASAVLFPYSIAGGGLEQAGPPACVFGVHSR